MNEELKKLSLMSLDKELAKIANNYSEIYDEYYTTGSRDSAFLKDLVDSIQGISAILEVYVRDKHINSNYALEKLYWSKSYIDSCIDYFENKENEVELVKDEIIEVVGECGKEESETLEKDFAKNYDLVILQKGNNNIKIYEKGVLAQNVTSITYEVSYNKAATLTTERKII